MADEKKTTKKKSGKKAASTAATGKKKATKKATKKAAASTPAPGKKKPTKKAAASTAATAKKRSTKKATSTAAKRLKDEALAETVTSPAVAMETALPAEKMAVTVTEEQPQQDPGVREGRKTAAPGLDGRETKKSSSPGRRRHAKAKKPAPVAAPGRSRRVSKATGGRIAVTQVRSPIGSAVPHKATLVALGLRRMNQTVEHTDTPSIRGMLEKVHHLIRVEAAR